MPDYIPYLPHLNAFLNATSAVFLIAGFSFIRARRIEAHRKCQVTAVFTSALFLISYLTYHYYHGETRFLGQGMVRPFYFAILISHVILAIVIVPLVIITVCRAARGDFIRHRRIARWTLPLWLYVSVTGVIVYLMLYHIYPSPPTTSRRDEMFIAPSPQRSKPLQRSGMSARHLRPRTFRS